MKFSFPKSTIEKTVYETAISDLLEGADSFLFFDTNIVKVMFNLNSAARSEFKDWVNKLKNEGRVAVPAWCLHEYSNRFIRSKLGDYVSYNELLNRVPKDLTALRVKLLQAADESTARDKQHADLNSYLLALTKAFAEATFLLPKANKKLDFLATVHNEIEALFSDVILPSDIVSLLLEAENEYRARFENLMPPGFKDDQVKETNKLGDLVLWKEVLSYCARHGKKKVIIVSDDQKKDWVYKPDYAKLPSSRVVANDSIFLLDNRLEYEFRKAVGDPAAEIFMLSFPTCIQALYRQDASKYKSLALGVQAIELESGLSSAQSANGLGSTDATTTLGVDGTTIGESLGLPAVSSRLEISGSSSTSDTVSLSLSTASASLAPSEIIQSNTGEGGVSKTKQSETSREGAEKTNASVQLGGVSYSSDAIADSNYDLTKEAPIVEVIAKLKSHDWYAQNPAMDSLSKSLLESASGDDLFVLGRNIVQAAEGSSYSAQRFIDAFPMNLSWISTERKTHVFNGMMYEVFFDSRGEFRYSKGKTRYLDQIRKTARLAGFQKSRDFIFTALAPYRKHVLLAPGEEDKKFKLELIFSLHEDDDSFIPKAFIVEYVVLEGVPVLKKQSDVSDMEEVRHFRHLTSFHVSELIAQVADSRYLPEMLMETQCYLDGKPASMTELSRSYIGAHGLLI